MTLDFALIAQDGSPLLQTNVPGKVECMAKCHVFTDAVPARFVFGTWQPILSDDDSSEARRRAIVATNLANVRLVERNASPLAGNRRRS